jgi:hypothetical protein
MSGLTFVRFVESLAGDARLDIESHDKFTGPVAGSGLIYLKAPEETRWKLT